MNYRHAYHAGNHADILKHVVIARVVEHLKKKEKPFRVLDAHAGIGLYSLSADEAAKTGEWRAGVGRLYNEHGEPVALPVAVEALLEPWRRSVAAINRPGSLAFYPGSPELVRHLMRQGDRLLLNELHPEDYQMLLSRYGNDPAVAVTGLDGAVAIKAQLPPPERRELILIDPPYEAENESDRAISALRQGLERFATGVFCLWYPMTGDGLCDALVERVRNLAIPRCLRIELAVKAVVREGGLAGSGLVVVNPPWRLDEEFDLLTPALCARLAQSEDARSRVEWLSKE